MHWLRFSYWRLVVGVGIVLMACVAALVLVPRSLSPIEMRLIGTWKQISPEPPKVMVLGQDRNFRITESAGQTQTWTGRWKANESNFVFTTDSSRMTDYFVIRMGWGNNEDQIPILALEDNVLKLGTEAKPIVFVRHDKKTNRTSTTQDRQLDNGR